MNRFAKLRKSRAMLRHATLEGLDCFAEVGGGGVKVQEET